MKELDTSIAEENCLELTKELWNAFNSMPSVHPDEITEFRHAIHEIQRIIMVRPIIRENMRKATLPKLTQDEPSVY